MRASVFALTLGQVLLSGVAGSAPAEPIRVELNAMENAEGRCRVSFVIENKGEAVVDTLRLDLVLFSRGGIVQRRIATDMGPVRAVKTIVKIFTLDGPCDEIGSILVNEVAACAPADANACLDRLALSSRIEKVRFYK
jgi:hypothetical protein